MRKITPKKYAISLYESLKDVPKDQMTIIIKSFMAVLIRNKDLKKANKIIKTFREYYNQSEGIQEVQISTAGTLDDQVKSKILKLLTSIMNKKIELRETVDKDLMGGMVLKYGDNVVDGSIKKRIELLAESLK